MSLQRDLMIVNQHSYIKDGLVAWYDGINNTGDGHSDLITKWKDLTGNGYDLTLYNNPTIQKNAVLFNGIDQYAACNSSPIYTTRNWHVELRFKYLNSTTAYEFPFSAKGVANATEPGFSTVDTIARKGSQGGITTLSFVIGAGNIIDISDSLWNIGSIKTMSYGSNGLDGCIGILDGLVISDNNIKALPSGTFLRNEIQVGRIYDANAKIHRFYANIAIQSIRIYNRILTASEALRNYNIDEHRFNN